MQRSSIVLSLCAGFGVLCGLVGAWVLASPTADGPSDPDVKQTATKDPARPTVRRFEPDRQRGGPAEPEAPANPVHEARRAAIQQHWGRPPERQAPPLDEAEVRSWLDAHAAGRTAVVDCFVQPCVAVVISDVPDPELRAASKVDYPHSIASGETFGTRGKRRHRNVIAFTSEPVARNSPEALFVHRLSRAVVHGTSVSEFDRLKAQAKAEDARGPE